MVSSSSKRKVLNNSSKFLGTLLEYHKIDQRRILTLHENNKKIKKV